MDKPACVRSFLDCSVDHLPTEEADLFVGCADGTKAVNALGFAVVEWTDDGSIIYVGHWRKEPETADERGQRQEVTSRYPAMTSVIAKALEYDCAYVWFDRDGCAVDGLHDYSDEKDD